MEFAEYPKRVYKGDESIIANTDAEEKEFLGVLGVLQDALQIPTQEEIDKAIKGYEERCPIPIAEIDAVQIPVVEVKRKAGRPPKPKT